MESRIMNYRLPREYDGRVVFSFGANDSGWAGKQQGIELSESIANARNILSQAKQLYPTLMVSPAPCGDHQIIANLSQEFALVCNQLDVPYLDVFSSLLKSPIWLAEAKANDGAHPKADGYTEFAAIVQNWEGWLNWFTP
jgi:lysophospholipase L1-like esterase